MRAILFFCCALTATAGVADTGADAAPAPSVADPLAQVRFLEGDWRGVVEGEPGVGTISAPFVRRGRSLISR